MSESVFKKAKNNLTHEDGFGMICKAFFKSPAIAQKYYVNHGVRWILRRTTGIKIRNKKYAGRKVLSFQTGEDVLYKALLENKPYMAGRIGETEMRFVAECITKEAFKRKQLNIEKLSKGCVNCGFFPPTEEAFIEFYRLMTESVSNCDLIGTMYNCLEDVLFKRYLSPTAQLTHRGIYDFWNYERPFTAALKGKNVLVIHPFIETIQKQYLEKRTELFENPNILPEFNLKCLKSVQTAAGENDDRFKTWFEALDYMYDEAMKTDFDIALIGCGAYGFPLASKIKNAGKTAVHMGGVLQILFGIKGKRWDRDGTGAKLYNEHWVHASKNETPQNAKKVEDSCYW